MITINLLTSGQHDNGYMDGQSESDVTIFGSCIADSDQTLGSFIAIHCHETNDIVDCNLLSHVNTFRPGLH